MSLVRKALAHPGLAAAVHVVMLAVLLGSAPAAAANTPSLTTSSTTSLTTSSSTWEECATPMRTLFCRTVSPTTPPPTQRSTDPRTVSKVVCNTATLNVRITPGTTYPPIATLTAGSVVFGTISNGWMALARPYAGRFVSATYLCTRPTPSSPLAPGMTYAPGTVVNPAEHQQVLVAKQTGGTTGSYHGTWARWEWNGSSWDQVGDTTTDVRFGKNGVLDGTVRVMGSLTTPAGTYALPMAFGEGNPGTRAEYRTITDCSWWMGTSGIPLGVFNRWYEACGTTFSDAEDLSYYRDKGYYRQAVVIAHNYYPPQITSGPGSSSAIFLHYTPAGGYTAGCVGLTNFTELVNTVRWLDPTKSPVIVIG